MALFELNANGEINKNTVSTKPIIKIKGNVLFMFPLFFIQAAKDAAAIVN